MTPDANPPLDARWPARFFRGALLALLYLASAGFVLNCFHEQWGFRDGEPAYAFTLQLEGRAERPVAYRVLVPAISRAVARVLPERLVDGMLAHNHGAPDAAKPRRSSVLLRYRWTRDHLAEKFVAYFLQLASLLVVLVASRALLREALGASRALADFAPPLGLLLLPLTFWRGAYPYDAPELAFCAVGLLLLVRRRWLAWYPCFALACLNKEADVLLAAQFAAMAWDAMPRRRLALHAAAHVLLGGAILLGGRLAFAANPGVSVAFGLADKLASFASEGTWVGLWDPYAPFVPTPRPYNLVTLAAIAIAAGLGWREKPRDLRRAFAWTMAVLLPLVAVSGYRDEIRNFSLAFAPFCLLACDSVRRAWALGEPSAAPGGARRPADG